MKTCTHCGRENGDAALSCAECGAALGTTTSLASGAPAISETAPGNPSSPASARRREIGGWLLFFCLTLTVFQPLAVLASIGYMLDHPEWSAGLPAELQLTRVLDLLIRVGLVAFGLFAGIQLWNSRPGCVATAKQYLWLTLIYPAFAIVSPFMRGLPAEALPYVVVASLPVLMASLAYFGTWYAYLTTSKRVKATYEI